MATQTLLADRDKTQAVAPSAPQQKNTCSPAFYPARIPLGGDTTLALDQFRSLPEGSWEGNWGGLLSLNLQAYINPSWQAQLAGSYGLYDWTGRSSTPFKNPSAWQQQAFATGAFSRETPCRCGFNFGLAYDWMFNKNFGEFAVNPTLSQLRSQLGYLIKGGNELGAWATINTNVSHKESQEVPLKFRAISQANLFWCHYFKNGAYGMLWGGTPYRRGLMHSSGRAGRYIFGARFHAPLTHALSLNGHAAYMGARSAHNGTESKNYAANICFGLTYSFGYRKVNPTPYMGLADNSNFLVDTNANL
jgi:hypothetical protein